MCMISGLIKRLLFTIKVRFECVFLFCSLKYQRNSEGI